MSLAMKSLLETFSATVTPSASANPTGSPTPENQENDVAGNVVAIGFSALLGLAFTVRIWYIVKENRVKKAEEARQRKTEEARQLVNRYGFSDVELEAISPDEFARIIEQVHQRQENETDRVSLIARAARESTVVGARKVVSFLFNKMALFQRTPPPPVVPAVTPAAGTELSAAGTGLFTPEQYAANERYWANRVSAGAAAQAQAPGGSVGRVASVAKGVKSISP